MVLLGVRSSELELPSGLINHWSEGCGYVNLRIKRREAGLTSNMKRFLSFVSVVECLFTKRTDAKMRILRINSGESG
jgi:hypothetical protein